MFLQHTVLFLDFLASIIMQKNPEPIFTKSVEQWHMGQERNG